MGNVAWRVLLGPGGPLLVRNLPDAAEVFFNRLGFLNAPVGLGIVNRKTLVDAILPLVRILVSIVLLHFRHVIRTDTKIFFLHR